VDNPEDWQWFNFFAETGNNVEIIIDRLTGDIDPVSACYQGLALDDGTMATIGDDPIGATFVESGDDDDPPNVPGPWGDPHYGFAAPADGMYSIVVGNYLGTPGGPGEYTIVVRGITPEPASLGLLAVGALAVFRRR
jgi:hypothetical protein